MKILATTCALLLAAASAAHAEPPDWWADARRYAAQIRPFANEIEATMPAKRRQAVIDTIWMPLNQYGTAMAMLGETSTAIDTFDQMALLAEPYARSRTAWPDDAQRAAAGTPRDAIDTIVELARSHRVVILNEAHHVPLHRAFALALAHELRKIGYSYLACETLYPNPWAGGDVTARTGYYSNEPVYANFLRAAVHEGWTLVPYEAQDENMAPRETGQARNLVERIFQHDPQARVFVYVGYAHAQEGPPLKADEISWMARELKSMTGLDPLTIDQTTMYSHPRPQAEHPLYRQLAALARDARPIMLRAPAGGYEVFGQYRRHMDLQVIHPVTQLAPQTLRPEWLTGLAHLHPRALPAALQPAHGQRLISAIPRGAPPDVVPADRVLLTAGAPLPQPMLPNGEFDLKIDDGPERPVDQLKRKAARGPVSSARSAPTPARTGGPR